MSRGDVEALLTEVQNLGAQVRTPWAGFLPRASLKLQLGNRQELRAKLWDSLRDKGTKAEAIQVTRKGHEKKKAQDRSSPKNITKTSPKN